MSFSPRSEGETSANGAMRTRTVAGEQEQVMMTDQAKLQDTLLHLLVPLVQSVFESDKSLLEAKNTMVETPLHRAAKVGNNDFISEIKHSDSDTVKRELRMTNKEGDTALHVAVKHGHRNVVFDLMKLDPEVANKINDEKLSPLNIAIINGNLKMVEGMLEVNSALARTPFSDGMLPVHVAARMGQTKMVMHFIDDYPGAAKLLDPHGRNLFHIAAEEGRNEIFRDILKGPIVREMKDAVDYEKNSMLHVAAMKGHLSLMKDIWEKCKDQDEENTHGLTPIDLFLRQLRATTKVDDSLARTIDQKKLSHKWFNNAMQLSLENQWDRTQVIGLGSVLIITVTFAAAFTIPGGYHQNDGTPLLGRSYMFRAFIIANTFAFMYGFLSLYKLLKGAMEGQPNLAHLFAIDTFLLAAYSMLLAFGLGLYVILASVCMPLAIIVLLSTFIICIVNNLNVRSDNWIIGLASYAVTILVIFGLPILMSVLLY